MKKFEYREHSHKDRLDVLKSNPLYLSSAYCLLMGLDGWELVTITKSFWGKKTYYWKREITKP